MKGVLNILLGLLSFNDILNILFISYKIIYYENTSWKFKGKYLP